jgi:hypothetical protein
LCLIFEHQFNQPNFSHKMQQIYIWCRKCGWNLYGHCMEILHIEAKSAIYFIDVTIIQTIIYEIIKIYGQITHGLFELILCDTIICRIYKKINYIFHGFESIFEQQCMCMLII